MKKIKVIVFSTVFMLALFASMFGAAVPAYASPKTEDSQAIVEVFRATPIFVLVRIQFPSPIDGNFGGVLGSHHFDCSVVSSNVLICFVRYRQGSDPALLTIYDKNSKEVVLQEVISSPVGGIGEEEDSKPSCDKKTQECSPDEG